MVPGDATCAGARLYLGIPYVWGGGHGATDPRDGLDCSGLVRHALWQAIGYDPGDDTAQGYRNRWPSAWNYETLDGDLLLFAWAWDGNEATRGQYEADHIAIRAGYQHAIQAVEPGTVVQEGPLSEYTLAHLIDIVRPAFQ